MLPFRCRRETEASHLFFVRLRDRGTGRNSHAERGPGQHFGIVLDNLAPRRL